jgi:hypothetical protein
MHSLEQTDIVKVFLTPRHVGQCYTNVLQGHCCATLWSSNGLRTCLHSRCSQSVQARSQDRGEVVRGTPHGTTTAGGQAPTNQASWGRAQAVKLQGLNNPSLE